MIVQNTLTVLMDSLKKKCHYFEKKKKKGRSLDLILKTSEH